MREAVWHEGVLLYPVDFHSGTWATLSLDADVVVEGTPIDLKRIITVNKPIANIRYELEEVEPGTIEEMVAKAIDKS